MPDHFKHIRKREQHDPRTISKESGDDEHEDAVDVPGRESRHSDPFLGLIIAYTACRKSIKDIKKTESARPEARTLLTTVDEMLENINKRYEDDRTWNVQIGVWDPPHFL